MHLPSRALRVHLSSRLALLIALLVSLALALGACSGDDDSDTAGDDGSSDTTTGPYEGSLDLEVGAVTVASSGDELPLDSKISKKVLAIVSGYVDDAVIEPLLSGEQAEDLERFFGLRVITRVQPDGADRAALTEENLPEIAADLEATARPVDLDALAGPDGAIVMVGAKLSVDVRTETADGPLSIRRVGTLILEPGTEGEWQITGYDVEGRRTTADGRRTTRASTESTATGAP